MRKCLVRVNTNHSSLFIYCDLFNSSQYEALVCNNLDSNRFAVMNSYIQVVYPTKNGQYPAISIHQLSCPSQRRHWYLANNGSGHSLIWERDLLHKKD